MQTIEVTWGEAVSAKVYKFPGGLKRAVDAIVAIVGANVGTRNTFSKLMRAERTEDLSPVFQWRAWLLLTTLDIEPRLWGIGNEVVPPAFDPETLREALRCATRDSNPQPSDP